MINFTGIVVTYNEAKRLRDCLKSLSFCEQLIVIDLGSNDASVKIAKEFGAEVFHHKKIPVVEKIHEMAVKNYARNEWIIRIDPDEVLPPNLKEKLEFLIKKEPDLGTIRIPWQFYVKDKPLYGTVWGMDNSKPVVLHKSRTKFNPYVHAATSLLEGYRESALPRDNVYYIRHYWVDSYCQMIRKHWMYLKKEGEARYSRGERFSVRKLLNDTINAFKHSLISCNGYRNVTGIFLSLFYSWYVLMGILSLRQYQKDVQGNKQNSTPKKS